MFDSATKIDYRLLRDVKSLRQVADLQVMIWGDDPAAHIPLHMLLSLANNGSPIIGAFDHDLMVGFSVGFFGLALPNNDRPAMANIKIASKRMAVHPDYRGNGIGYQLKLEQLNFANEQGVRLITWTFDPLISRNAYLYIHKVGAIVRAFVRDFYADAPGQIDSITQTDRCFCEWWVTSNRVEERINGTRPPLTLDAYLSGNAPILNPTTVDADGIPQPYMGSIELPDSSLVLIEIPERKEHLSQNDELGQIWRDHSRFVFALAFQNGYVATDFLHETYEGRERSFYVMGFDG